mmetsp:Transcript_114189/g.355593  ORF Transcript_114189/g.355593 Transcript_114189/m.355593 type:complete len:346 (-) Transcript_114189:360-1397(-)
MGGRHADAQWWLLVMLMPFFYACATRLPFIAYAIQAFRFGFHPVEVGALIASYQLTRAIGNWLQGRLPHLPWCIAAYTLGVAGYAANLAYASRALGRYQFCVGFAVAGFTEVLPCLTTWLKEAYADVDRDVQRRWYRTQYTVINMGSAFCFGVGGVLYDKCGIHGVAYFGAASALLGLLTTIAYGGYLPRRSPPRSADKPFGTAGGEQPEGSWRGMTWIEYVLGFSFGVESTTIAIVLSVGPVLARRVRHGSPEVWLPDGRRGVPRRVPAAADRRRALARAVEVAGAKPLAARAGFRAAHGREPAVLDPQVGRRHRLRLHRPDPHPRSERLRRRHSHRDAGQHHL